METTKKIFDSNSTVPRVYKYHDLHMQMNIVVKGSISILGAHSAASTVHYMHSKRTNNDGISLLLEKAYDETFVCMLYENYKPL